MTTCYALLSTPDALAAHFGLGALEPFPPREAIRPTEPVAIVRRSHRGARELHLVRWGLLPGWAKDPSTIGGLFTARAETAADKPSFRGGLRHRRCLVPADGFYVWTGAGRRRQAHLISPEGGGLMGLAAIADHWLGADGIELETMAILTRPAQAGLSTLADRLPVIIPPPDYDRWLDCRGGEAASVADLLRAGADGLVAREIAGPLPGHAVRRRPDGAQVSHVRPDPVVA
jgi:putative SOS response-associated peptidase YedK